jgi:dolichol-phosphate mannosyltransferase
MTADPRLSVVIPARDEGELICDVLDRLFETVRMSCEVLVVVDSADDCTCGVVESYAEKEPRLACLVSSYGGGPAQAIRYGLDAARAPVLAVMMAEGSDDAGQVDGLARLVERGAAVAAASRYMAGGRQVGGPRLKRLLSHAAGRSLQLLAWPGPAPATRRTRSRPTTLSLPAGSALIPGTASRSASS